MTLAWAVTPCILGAAGGDQARPTPAAAGTVPSHWRTRPAYLKEDSDARAWGLRWTIEGQEDFSDPGSFSADGRAFAFDDTVFDPDTSRQGWGRGSG